MVPQISPTCEVATFDCYSKVNVDYGPKKKIAKEKYNRKKSPNSAFKAGLAISFNHTKPKLTKI